MVTHSRYQIHHTEGAPLWFLRDSAVESSHVPGTVEWFDDVLVKGRDGRKRSFNTAAAARRALARLDLGL